MLGYVEQYLEERARVLSDARKTSFPHDPPMVCRVCYYIQDYSDLCLCVDRPSWTLLDVALAEISIKLRRHAATNGSASSETTFTPVNVKGASEPADPRGA